NNGALVLFSGGQDSTTCLLWALKRFGRVETVGFDYGQRHSVELTARRVVLGKITELFPELSAKLGPDTVLDASVLSGISETALTENKKIEFGKNGLPNTFVPARNLLFLTLAGALAYRRGISTLVIGVSQADYSGYPDCRSRTMDAMENALSFGLDTPVKIASPLMELDKAGVWALADSLGGKPFTDLIVRESRTCYTGDVSVLHPWGYGCGECPACVLRKRGFETFASKTNRP
ncbi:MAG: 7-cyano-7-deazaguanine synthase QueC, partial [Thermoguttaceae bacterium]|nr:7-cyano-7-deazaguanine synthase QueC [Thermoguttaceae bacterium]